MKYEEGSPEHGRFLDAHGNATAESQSRSYTFEQASGKAATLQKRLDNWPKKGMGSGSMMRAQIEGAAQAYSDHASLFNDRRAPKKPQGGEPGLTSL